MTNGMLHCSRSRTAGHGRDFLFAVNADSSLATRRELNGRSSKRRAQHRDPKRSAARWNLWLQTHVAAFSAA